MTDIPNTEYITINKDGIFVGGKPATTYRGEDICFSSGVRKWFADIQRLNKNVAELHVLSSETFGEYAKVGNPSGSHGLTAWCRVKFNDGRIASWVFGHTYGSAADCAHYCAYNCEYAVRHLASFRSAVFGLIDKRNTKTAIQPEKKSQNPELKKLEQVDFSKLPTKPIELNGYRIVVEKIAQNTK